jgi:hypothetical protein
MPIDICFQNTIADAFHKIRKAIAFAFSREYHYHELVWVDRVATRVFGSSAAIDRACYICVTTHRVQHVLHPGKALRAGIVTGGMAVSSIVASMCEQPAAVAGEGVFHVGQLLACALLVDLNQMWVVHNVGRWISRLQIRMYHFTAVLRLGNANAAGTRRSERNVRINLLRLQGFQIKSHAEAIGCCFVDSGTLSGEGGASGTHDAALSCANCGGELVAC